METRPQVRMQATWVKGPGRRMWGGPATGLASSIANSLVSRRQSAVRPVRVWFVWFMLSFRSCAIRTPLLAGIHSYNSLPRRLTRWLPRRSGALPLPPRRGVVGAGARSFAATSIAVAFGVGVGFIAYENYQPFRHTVLAVVRCSRVAGE